MNEGAFHRAILIEPNCDEVSARVEDDYHHMHLVLYHDSTVITGVDAKIFRAPWTTCPGAEAVIRKSFVGVRLAEAPKTPGKTENCTHLFDLALFAAAHAADKVPTRYDVRATDPVDGVRDLTLARNGMPQLHWTERDRVIVAPEALAGRSLFQLGDVVASAAADDAEMIRILRWASIMGIGRTIPEENLGDALTRSPVCFTYQPENARKASRGASPIVDFSTEERRPLEADSD